MLEHTDMRHQIVDDDNDVGDTANHLGPGFGITPHHHHHHPAPGHPLLLRGGGGGLQYCIAAGKYICIIIKLYNCVCFMNYLNMIMMLMLMMMITTQGIIKFATE